MTLIFSISSQDFVTVCLLFEISIEIISFLIGCQFELASCLVDPFSNFISRSPRRVTSLAQYVDFFRRRNFYEFSRDEKSGSWQAKSTSTSFKTKFSSKHELKIWEMARAKMLQNFVPVSLLNDIPSAVCFSSKSTIFGWKSFKHVQW